MRVLGLCSYPVESAATRFRMAQFVEPLREHGIELTISPFLDSGQFGRLYQKGGGLRKASGMIRPLIRRLREVLSVGKYDLIFVQREAMFFGPAVFEPVFQKFGRLPIVLDLDDATYVPYTSPSYGRWGSALKFFGKTDKLIERAASVICGNRFIAEYVESKGTKAIVIPTVVDTDKFYPVERNNIAPVIGWIGTHSTYPLLEQLFPVIADLAKKHKFTLKIVGAGRDDIAVPGVEISNLEWNLDREIADFQSLDIGLYPIFLTKSANEQWIQGKSGFKAIQYMAVGIPFVMSPVGVCGEIGKPNQTHLNAVNTGDWYNPLDRLLSDHAFRLKMGRNGREHAIENYQVSMRASALADLFHELCGT